MKNKKLKILTYCLFLFLTLFLEKSTYAENSVRKNANKAHTKKVANKLISQQFPGRDLDKDVIKYNEFISGHSNTIIYDSLVDNPINIYNQNTTITW